MNQEQLAFKLEIENAMKKWANDCEKVNLQLIISVSIKSDEKDGFNHMRSVNAKASTLCNHALATVDSLSETEKSKITIPMLGVLTNENDGEETKLSEDQQN